MESLLKSQREDKIKAGTDAEARARKEKKNPRDIKKSKSDAERPYSTAISTLERGLAESRMYLALKDKNLEEAKTQYAKVRDFRNERKALLQLEFGNQEEAIKLAASAVKSAPEQARPLAAQAYILHRANKREEAKNALNHLRRIAPELDMDIQWFSRLSHLAQSLNLPKDWRQKQPTAKDMGLRPKLDDLGPFRWSPSPAPDWTLRDRNGQSFSLKSHQGKPMILIFYLGKGCTHCMDQLNAFDPLTKEFDSMGITLMAVSTDTTAGLLDTFIGYDAKDRHFSFPLLSDPTLATFKKYRAYDDFEKTPLHGTFLIDPSGRILWQEISYEPFMAPKFLLEEAKRLLAQPTTK
jgi:peroxiredoxin